jgi:hypothetical protein
MYCFSKFIILKFSFLCRFKDGEELHASDHVKLTALPDGSVRLYIDSVIPTDCGAYRLVATNKNGEATAISAIAVKRKCFTSIMFLSLHTRCSSSSSSRKLLCNLCMMSTNRARFDVGIC